MSKVDASGFRVPSQYNQESFIKILRDLAYQVNGLSEGTVAATYNAHTAAPTSSAMPFAQGDFIRNSLPTELGSGGSKYVILGFVCTVSGSPGTWVQARALTGN